MGSVTANPVAGTLENQLCRIAVLKLCSLAVMQFCSHAVKKGLCSGEPLSGESKGSATEQLKQSKKRIEDAEFYAVLQIDSAHSGT